MIITTKRHIQSSSSLLVMMFILFFVGCTYDGDDLFPKDDGVRVLFSVNLPAKSYSRTTQPTNEVDESKISQIYALAFDNDGKLVDWADTKEIFVGESSSKNFVVNFAKLKVGEGHKYKFVLLANVDNPLGVHTEGAERDNILNSLTLSMEGKWNSEQIPMWAEQSEATPITGVATTVSMKLLRMVARINVSVSDNVPAQGEESAQSYFKLTSVHLYNSSKVGRVVPDIDNLVENSMSLVKAPTLATNIDKNEALLYDIIKDGISLSAPIYTFEAKNIDVDDENMTSLVIGGDYNNEGKTTYYRVNFHNTDGDNINLLRNHSYTVSIVSIKGSGYDTPQDAFNAKAINMEANVVEWNDANVGEIHESGDYRLSISPSSELTFYGEVQHTKSININTNAPDGWEVLRITDTKDGEIDNVNWLTVNNNKGAIGATPMAISVIENTGTDRVAYIHIKFSRTIVLVTVTQHEAGKTILEVTSDDGSDVSEITFTSINEAQSQTLDINWHPSANSLFITNSNSDFNWALPIPESAETGQYRLSIKPTPFTDKEKEQIIERTSTLSFKVTNGSNTATKSVTVHHINYAVVPSGLDEYFKADGGSKSFNVKSNANWRIANIEEKITTGSGTLLNSAGSGNLVVGKEFDANAASGTSINFTTANNANAFGTVTVTVESTDTPKKFADKEIVLNFGLPGYVDPHNGWAGSNIYWDGEKMTFDDVGETARQNYQGLYFKWGSLWGISPVGNWSGDVILYSPDGSSGTATSYKMPEWTDIPYVDADVDIFRRDYAYLYTLPLDDVGGNKPDVGDICKYITIQAGGTLHGKKWRMPISMEFEASGNYTKFGIFSAQTSNSADGTMTFSSGYTKTDKGGPSYPASGLRLNSNGSLHHVGTYGYYWSSSPRSSTLGYYLYFISSAVYPAYSIGSRAYGFSVRCVAE